MSFTSSRALTLLRTPPATVKEKGGAIKSCGSKRDGGKEGGGMEEGRDEGMEGWREGGREEGRGEG